MFPVNTEDSSSCVDNVTDKAAEMLGMCLLEVNVYAASDKHHKNAKQYHTSDARDLSRGGARKQAPVRVIQDLGRLTAGPILAKVLRLEQEDRLVQSLPYIASRRCHH